MSKKHATLCAVTLLTITVGAVTLPQNTLAERGQPLAERKAMYAPWSPDQMAQRRKELGLIGPCTTKPVPTPAFPSYLKQPDSI